jgi:hypothetical protein
VKILNKFTLHEDDKAIYDNEHHFVIDDFFHNDFLKTLFDITRVTKNFTYTTQKDVPTKQTHASHNNINPSSDLYPPIQKDIGADLTLSNHNIYYKLNFLFNSKEFINFGRQLLNNDSITKTSFRLFLLDNTCGPGLDWHTDATKVNRFAAIRVELSETPYSGGKFQLRNKKSKEILFTLDGLKVNQACLFKIDYEQFEHRLLAVTSKSRSSLIIWFE